MTGGFTGKILRINLTTKSITTLDTAKYEEFGGGFGIGAAIFWDLAVAPGEWDLQDAYDPHNVLAIMSGPLAATGVPGAGRTSVCGISPKTFPTNIFYRTSFGGRFATSLKLAGWDGVVVEGKADRPVYENGKWGYQALEDMCMDKQGVELFKTNFYELEGWDVETGWPTRKTLEDLGMKQLVSHSSPKEN
jgi:aldehyde:ferredoxin oxidoreductase